MLAPASAMPDTKTAGGAPSREHGAPPVRSGGSPAIR